MQDCLSCGEQVELQFENCWKCGSELPALRKHNFRVRPVISGPSQKHDIVSALPLVNEKDFSFKPVWVFTVVLMFALVLGNFHIVTGVGSGLRLIQRASFGYSEIYVDGAALNRLPPLAAFMRSPLGYRALDREGLIEDNHREFEH